MMNIHLNKQFLRIKQGLITALCLASMPCFAGLLDDNEARKAILELRTEVRQRDNQHTETINQLNAKLTQELMVQTKQQQLLNEEIELLKRTVLDLNNLLVQTKEANARLSGQLELLVNQQQNYASDLNKQAVLLQTHQTQVLEQLSGLDKRTKQLEPSKSLPELEENTADAGEDIEFNQALATFKSANYASASQLFAAFITKYPNSESLANAYFWLGNARYADRNAKAAINTFNLLLKKFPDYAKAPEAALTLAQSYEDIDDVQRSQAVYQSIISKYPNTSAAQMAKQALSKKTVTPTSSVKKVILTPKKN
jgi:tol-pal system protein YbgF